MILAYTSGQYSAFWAAVGAIATVITGLVATFTLLALRRDSSDRSRPVMSADLYPTVLTDGDSELIVRNLGASVAKNINVTFSPQIPDLVGPAAVDKVTPFLYRRYATPIPTMAPGRELVNIYSVGVPDGSGTYRNDEPVPEEFTVRFDYEDSRGRKYSDEYDLSLATLRDATGAYPSNTDEAGMRRRSLRAIEAIARGIGRH